jgi:hypothetical protein
MGIKRWRLRTANRREWRGICEVARVIEVVSKEVRDYEEGALPHDMFIHLNITRMFK